MAKRDLIFWSPFKELEDLKNEIDKFFNWDYDSPIKLNAPAIDIEQDENNFYIKADIPGLTKDDIEIELKDGMLTLRGEKKVEKEEKKKECFRKERWEGKFERTISLPDYIDTEKAEATYNNGVLEITLPKKEEKKPKKLTLKIK
ncbi:MAG: Hsp20/alpha crystallin family protein [Spirochaetes bacterium]|nr:Hsp20/alpha crystallin family protein [Spirochaetota bacterium]